ncbi:MAG: hypothetical protein WCQ50_21960 [Spirochaetota bacterium]
MSADVILPGKTARELDVLLEIFKADSAVKSIILFGLKDFDERKPFPTLERKIAREGKVLYAA